MPEGVLKTQLLGDFANLVGIGNRELQNLWQGPTNKTVARNARPTGDTANNVNTFKKPFARSNAAPRSIPMRRQAPSRQDRALQILFADMQQWGGLSQQQHRLLMDLPAPHGPLLTWLDQQWHEHGVQPLAAVREGLRGHAHEAILMRLIDEAPPDMDNDAGELQSILNGLEKVHLAAQIDDLTQRMGSDPAAYAQIKQLNARLAVLKTVPLV
jgi:DNA primase